MNELTAYAEGEGVGSGGFAEVLEAIHLATRQRVALKKSRTPADCIARTKREIEVQRLLLHGNVMPITDWATDGSWFVMPLAVGDLAKMNERRKVEGSGLLRLVEDVCAGLAAAHRRGLVHRDLTPANILWLTDRWVVADWGFVKLPPDQSRTKLTRTGVGTACFTAPEVYKDGNAATPASDIYSVGRIAEWLIVQEPPEPGRVTQLPEENPWAVFVRETTREDPAERPQTIEQAMTHLTKVYERFASIAPTLPESTLPEVDVEAAATSSLRTMLQNPGRRIDLEVFMDRETERAFEQQTPTRFSVQVQDEGRALETRLNSYVETCGPLLKLLRDGCAYGEPTQAKLWTKVIRRIGHPQGEWGGMTQMLNLRQFPALLLMYTGGLAAFAREEWGNLRAVVQAPRLNKTVEDDEQPAGIRLVAGSVLEHRLAQTMPGRGNRYTPFHDWIFEHLREPLRPIIRADSDYERTFDRFEHLLSMALLPVECSLQQTGIG